MKDGEAQVFSERRVFLDIEKRSAELFVSGVAISREDESRCCEVDFLSG